MLKVKWGGNSTRVNTRGKRLGDAPLHDIFSGYQQDFSWPGCHLTSYASCTTLSHTQNYRISINQDHCHLTVLVAMLTAVALLQCIGVLSCGCPNSSSVSRKIIPSLQLSKRAPSLALAVGVTTNQRMAHIVKNAPFNQMGSPSMGDNPIKKCPQALLQASASKIYKASKCTFMIMLEA